MKARTAAGGGRLDIAIALAYILFRKPRFLLLSEFLSVVTQSKFLMHDALEQ